MAKKDEILLDDIDNDFDFDLDFNFDDDVDTGSRKPVNKAKKGLSNFIKSTSKGVFKGLKNRLKKEMPNSDALLTEGKDFVGDLKYLSGDFIADLNPALLQVKRSGKMLTPKLRGVLNDNVVDKIDRLLDTPDEEPSRTIDPETERTNAINANIAEILKEQTKLSIHQGREELKDKTLGKMLDTKRHSDLISELSGIRTASISINNYHKTATHAYYKKSLELNYRLVSLSKDTYEAIKVMSKILEAKTEQIRHNTSLPDIQKITASEIYKQTATNKIAENVNTVVSGLFSKMMEKATAKSKEMTDQANMMSSMMGSMVDLTQSMDGIGPKKTMTDRAIDLLGMGAGNIISGRLNNKFFGRKNHSNETIAKVQDFFYGKANEQGIAQGQKQLMEAMAGNTKFKMALAARDYKENNPLSMFAEFLPDIQRGAGSIKTGGSNPLDPAIYDNATKTSIIEVIPGYLSKILQQVTITNSGNMNTPELVFDHIRKDFVSETTFRKDLVTRTMGDAKARAKSIDASFGILKGSMSASGKDNKSLLNAERDVKTFIANLSVYKDTIQVPTLKKFSQDRLLNNAEENYINYAFKGINPKVQKTVAGIIVDAVTGGSESETQLVIEKFITSTSKSDLMNNAHLEKLATTVGFGQTRHMRGLGRQEGDVFRLNDENIKSIHLGEGLNDTGDIERQTATDIDTYRKDIGLSQAGQLGNKWTNKALQYDVWAMLNGIKDPTDMIKSKFGFMEGFLDKDAEKKAKELEKEKARQELLKTTYSTDTSISDILDEEDPTATSTTPSKRRTPLGGSFTDKSRTKIQKTFNIQKGNVNYSSEKEDRKIELLECICNALTNKEDSQGLSIPGWLNSIYKDVFGIKTLLEVQQAVNVGETPEAVINEAIQSDDTSPAKKNRAVLSSLKKSTSGLGSLASKLFSAGGSMLATAGTSALEAASNTLEGKSGISGTGVKNALIRNIHKDSILGQLLGAEKLQQMKDTASPEVDPTLDDVSYKAGGVLQNLKKTLADKVAKKREQLENKQEDANARHLKSINDHLAKSGKTGEESGGILKMLFGFLGAALTGILGKLGLGGLALGALKLGSKVLGGLGTAAAVVGGSVAKSTADLVSKSPLGAAALKSGGAAVGMAGKMGSKIIPGLGLTMGAYGAYSRAKDGDWTGAAMEAASGLAAMIPGIGTATAIAIQMALALRDNTNSGKLTDKEKKEILEDPHLDVSIAIAIEDVRPYLQTHHSDVITKYRETVTNGQSWPANDKVGARAATLLKTKIDDIPAYSYNNYGTTVTHTYPERATIMAYITLMKEPVSKQKVADARVRIKEKKELNLKEELENKTKHKEMVKEQNSPTMAVDGQLTKERLFTPSGRPFLPNKENMAILYPGLSFEAAWSQYKKDRAAYKTQEARKNLMGPVRPEGHTPAPSLFDKNGDYIETTEENLKKIYPKLTYVEALKQYARDIRSHGENLEPSTKPVYETEDFTKEMSIASKPTYNTEATKAASIDWTSAGGGAKDVLKDLGVSISTNKQQKSKQSSPPTTTPVTSTGTSNTSVPRSVPGSKSGSVVIPKLDLKDGKIKPVTSMNATTQKLKESFFKAGRSASASVKKLNELGVKSYTNLGGGGMISVAKVNPDLLNRFAAAAEEFKSVTGKTISITSAFRSREDQKGLASTQSNAAKYKSKHEMGLAIDVGNKYGGGVMGRGYGTGTIADAFKPYAAKYGLFRPFEASRKPKEEQHFELMKNAPPLPIEAPNEDGDMGDGEKVAETIDTTKPVSDATISKAVEETKKSDVKIAESSSASTSTASAPSPSPSPSPNSTVATPEDSKASLDTTPAKSPVKATPVVKEAPLKTDSGTKPILTADGQDAGDMIARTLAAAMARQYGTPNKSKPKQSNSLASPISFDTSTESGYTPPAVVSSGKNDLAEIAALLRQLVGYAANLTILPELPKMLSSSSPSYPGGANNKIVGRNMPYVKPNVNVSQDTYV